MDSFKQYYERLSIMNLRDEDIEPISLNNDESDADEILSDISSNKISREYFERIDHETSRLIAFYHDNIAKPATRAIFYEHIPETKKKGFGDLKLCLLIDVLRCYDGLDHPTNLTTPEGVALLIFLSKAYRPKFFFTYETLCKIPERIINLDAIVPYIGACSDEIWNDEAGLIISNLFHEINPKADILYRQLIYSLCEAIAKVDGVISICEKEWLMRVLRLDDGDENTNINIDSIFTARE